MKKGFVDHTAYTTASLLRTIELILGLPPMSQYDAAATSLWRCMNNTPDHPAIYSKGMQYRPRSERTLLRTYGRRRARNLISRKEDMISDRDFNEVIWKAVKGFDSECPATVHAAFFVAVEDEEED